MLRFTDANDRGELWINPAAIRTVKQGDKAVWLWFDSTHYVVVEESLEETMALLLGKRAQSL
jgi:hypothetical protein